MLAKILLDATARLERAFKDVTETVSGRIDRTGNRAWSTAVSAERADQRVAGDIRHVALPTRAGSPVAQTELKGWTPHGRRVSFEVGDVHTIPLKDRDGNVIGVSFPSRRGDAGSIKRWARAKNRTGDRTYFLGNARDGKSLWSAHNEPQAHPAPWTDRVSGRPPVYINAHGSPNSFDVAIRNSKGHLVKVNIDGETMGRIIAGNKHFQQAGARLSDRPVVFLSCNAGTARGSAAKSAAKHLHDTGALRADAYAATGEVNLTTNPLTGTSKIGVEAQTDVTGKPTTPWTVQRAPTPTQGNASRLSDDTDPHGFPPIAGL